MEFSFTNPHSLPSKPRDFPLATLEMIAFQGISSSYTSLKDLLPQSPPSTVSATIIRRDSWRDIPIKDPLLQHAAWAYLKPVAVEPIQGERGWRRFQDKCRGLFGCFNDVVLVLFKCWFSDLLIRLTNNRQRRQTKPAFFDCRTIRD